MSMKDVYDLSPGIVRDPRNTTKSTLTDAPQPARAADAAINHLTSFIDRLNSWRPGSTSSPTASTRSTTRLTRT
jgi:hypothetical protein